MEKEKTWEQEINEYGTVRYYIKRWFNKLFKREKSSFEPETEKDFLQDFLNEKKSGCYQKDMRPKTDEEKWMHPLKPLPHQNCRTYPEYDKMTILLRQAKEHRQNGDKDMEYDMLTYLRSYLLEYRKTLTLEKPHLNPVDFLQEDTPGRPQSFTKSQDE